MKSGDIKFYITEKVLTLGVKGVYLIITGSKNKDRDKAFEVYKTTALNELIKEYNSSEFLDNDSILKGFRDLHTKMGRSNRRFVSSPEALAERFQKTGNLPHVNLLVDIYNLLSLKTRLALGAHDINRIAGNVSLKLTTGLEKYVPLGKDLAETIFPGEYGYIDDNNEVICRMEVLQSEKTKVGIDSTDCFYIIQGNLETSDEYLLSAAEELINLTKKYCGGKYKILYPPQLNIV